MDDERIEAQLRSVRSAIVAYLAKSPAASDTPEGICRWWLGSLGLEHNLTMVERALEELVGTGELRRRQLPDGGTVYLAQRAGEE